jgi:hypothetical protein
MLKNVKITNKKNLLKPELLKTVINSEFLKEHSKNIFYSMEITPKSELNLNFNEFKKQPLFVGNFFQQAIYFKLK